MEDSVYVHQRRQSAVFGKIRGFYLEFKNSGSWKIEMEKNIFQYNQILLIWYAVLAKSTWLVDFV